MDILIKNVEMPKEMECVEILLFSNGHCSFRKHERDEWVEAWAIEVPPHDDLISRRDAIDAVYGYHINNHPMKELEELIPVIPASQGKENKPYYSDPSCKYNMWDGE